MVINDRLKAALNSPPTFSSLWFCAVLNGPILPASLAGFFRYRIYTTAQRSRDYFPDPYGTTKLSLVNYHNQARKAL